MFIAIPAVETVPFFDIGQENGSAQHRRRRRRSGPVVDCGSAGAGLGLQVICSRSQRWRIGKRGE